MRAALIYPSLGKAPVVLVNLVSSHAGKRSLLQMMIDTGAERTCVPAKFDTFLGHDNAAAGVKQTSVKGIGGSSNAFIHTLRIELIDPVGSIASRLICPWRSGLIGVLFVEKMDTSIGLIGRDVISQWRAVRLRSTPRRLSSAWQIEIEV